MSHLLYGRPPESLVEPVEGAIQVSPLVPNAASLERLPPAEAAGAIMLAPPGTRERRHELALVLRALSPGGLLTVLAPKDMGGARLPADLERFGCEVEVRAKRHHRICRCFRPDALDGLEGAIAEGEPRRLGDLGLWSQPGLFSWDRLDPGTMLLRDTLPALHGRGADFGCGIGILAHAVLASAAVTRLHLLDIDRRAIEATRRNVADPRADPIWIDVRAGTPFHDLDFVVMNPPFHDAGREDRGLGQAFIARAAEALKRGGRLWLVANRHLPYEAVLKPLFKRITPREERDGFKVFEAQT